MDSAIIKSLLELTLTYHKCREGIYTSTIKIKKKVSNVPQQYTATIEGHPYLADCPLPRSLGGPYLGAQAKKFLDDQCFSSPFPIYYMVFPAMYELFQSNWCWTSHPFYKCMGFGAMGSLQKISPLNVRCSGFSQLELAGHWNLFWGEWLVEELAQMLLLLFLGLRLAQV